MLSKFSEFSVWTIRLDTFHPQNLDCLSPDEWTRAQQFKFVEHRERYLKSRYFLRNLLSEFLKIPADKIQFLLGPQQKPFLENTPLHFNLSHSNQYCAIAIHADCELGLDIEKKQDRDFEALAQRFFHKDELNRLKRLLHEDQAQEFYRIWAAKEAILKGIGQGLHYPLDAINIPDERETQKVSLPEYGTWFLKHFKLGDDYLGAVASTTPIESVVIQAWPNINP